MRSIKTFVLHLYTDSDAPERLCGDVRPLEDLESYPFKDEYEFEILLRSLIKNMFQPPTIPTDVASRENE
jgi:hypothetical protein